MYNFKKGGDVMIRDRVIRRALKKSGYNVDSINFEYDEIYKTATETLEELVIDIQMETGLANNVKFSILTKVTEPASHDLKDLMRMYPDAEVYSLPEDYLEYIGSTASENNCFITGQYVVVLPNPDLRFQSVFQLTDEGFGMHYRCKHSLDNLPEVLETYATLKLAFELVLNLRSDDGNRLQILRSEIDRELAKLNTLDRLRLPLTDQYMIGGKVGWK
jgi:hypothetical protein